MSIETTDNCDIIEGVVDEVVFQPGRPDVLRLNFGPPVGGHKFATIDFADDALDIRVDGVPLVEPHGYVKEIGAVLVFLLGTRCTAKAWCRRSHYGSAVRAEFTTIAETTP